MKFLLILVAQFVLSTTLFSQELKCRVQVNTQKIQGTNKKIFENLQSSIYEFLNNKKWTNHVYSEDELIECNIMITLLEDGAGDEFKATIQVTSSRPVYKSVYSTPVLNHMDNDFQFRYIEFQTLEFNESQHTSNLTSVLAYYAYIIIGFDYDSFSNEGGTEYYQKAEKIVNNAQNESTKGWKAFEHGKKNRYWLVENLMSEKYQPIRECIYQYHRLGLDGMVSKPVDGRAIIAESLPLLRKVHRESPGSILMSIFMNAKSDELVNIFSESFPDEKNSVYNILKEVDPANSSKYAKIISAAKVGE